MAGTVEEPATESVATVSADGEITLPPEVRRSLGLEDGGEVVVALDEAGGSATLRPRSAVDRARAAARRLGTPLDLDDARRRFETDWPRGDLVVGGGPPGEGGR